MFISFIVRIEICTCVCLRNLHYSWKTFSVLACLSQLFKFIFCRYISMNFPAYKAPFLPKSLRYILGFASQKAFQQKLRPRIRPNFLEPCSSVCQRRSLQPRRGIVNVSAIPVIAWGVCYWVQRCDNTGMTKQNEGRRLALSRKSPFLLVVSSPW